MNAQNLTNTQWSSTLVAGSLRVQQPCGDNGKRKRDQKQGSDSDTWTMQLVMQNSSGGPRLVQQQRHLERRHMTMHLQIVESVSRGPPHERDTRINDKRDALPMVLMNAAWMT